MSGRWFLIPVSVGMQRWPVGSPHRGSLTTSTVLGPHEARPACRRKCSAYAYDAGRTIVEVYSAIPCGSALIEALADADRAIEAFAQAYTAVRPAMAESAPGRATTAAHAVTRQALGLAG